MRRSSGEGALRLDDDSHRCVFLSAGLGHALVALTAESTVVYLCSERYAPRREHGIHPLDASLGIDWPVDPPPLLSDKDAAAPTLVEAARAGLLPAYAAYRPHCPCSAADDPCPFGDEVRILRTRQDRVRRRRTPSASRMRRTCERPTSIPSARAAAARASKVHSGGPDSSKAHSSPAGSHRSRPGGMCLRVRPDPGDDP
ncbi:dTDP-4-dehydrorhamnose 3,5-epimerase family protein [Streptomyces sp. DSM 40750]|uniref:dTDP-4-dehydrorhamnose 3,5-epimerase family protein n=1 Tax=Streptomyces sp. DSM 40750 TaxID=2801030 RepID=UPI003FA6B7C2